MSTLVIPQGYKAPLPNYEQQRAIAFIKESFQTNLSNALNLRRVSAPLFVASDSGLNDNLNGTRGGTPFRPRSCTPSRSAWPACWTPFPA